MGGPELTKHIQLAKPYTPNKLGDKVYMSEKLDGVPVRMDFRLVSSTNDVLQEGMWTRQGEYPVSCEMLRRRVREKLVAYFEARGGIKFDATLTFVGEVTHEDYTDFKDVSGVVRKQSVQTGLIFNAFDFADSRYPDMPFANREYVPKLMLTNEKYVRVIPQYSVHKKNIEAYAESVQRPNMEGLVIRDADDKWAPGKRTWGYQKYVPDPTIDIRLCSVQEAMSEDGRALGMAGRLNFWYNGEQIGVGPGRLSHEERRALWQEMQHMLYVDGAGPMACIKYKRDDSYAALRQPTFQHWRHDKDIADA